MPFLVFKVASSIIISNMSPLARKAQFGGAERRLGVLYGRVVTQMLHTIADLPAITTSGTSRFKFTVHQSADNLRFTYINWYNNTYRVTPQSQDNPNTAPITIQALVFPQGSSTGIVVKFRGENTWTIPAGGWVQSDPLPLSVVTGETFDVQTYVNGTQWYPTINGGGGFAAGNQAQVGSTKIGSTSGSLYAPAVITGRRNGPAVLLIGDSISYSGGTIYTSFTERGLEGKYGVINAAASSDTAARAVEGSSRTYSFFANKDATTVVCEYGVNDVSYGYSLAVIQANLLALWNRHAGYGQRVIQTTITPYSTSTDNWATVTNQTTKDAAEESRRVQLNTWIRAGAPIVNGVAVAPGTAGAIVAGSTAHPLYGYWEITDKVESARNTGLWKPGLTGDGLHPNGAGSVAAAAGVDSSMIG